ncbi:hypothetical protein [Methylobacterium brachythecii]|uniref:Lipoprotein n=1 Tax=Methylobacterium brachythecii TaxID=1176177 RepID=A0A7W6ARV7_9HYPH|nr:hypothetical protein [Methylobacterium brachythecii]MBB3904802.1 hypothetical protein [Methylobacterium brachythecii]GLS45355.1 hypothetical protein GCM10007884_33450 [Methylobacterium brachythecii]
MTGSFVRCGAGLAATIAVACAGLPAIAPSETRASETGLADGLAAIASGFGGATDTVVHGWKDMGRALGRMQIPDLPSATLLTTHQACVDPTGMTSSDCTSAVDAICRRHGFQNGQQIDMESGQVCRMTPQGRIDVAHAFACKSKVWLTQVACW